MKTLLNVTLIVMLCGSALALYAATDAPAFPKKIESEVLPNAFQLTDKVISGGQPEGEAAFKQLKELGVRTIITVDGAAPDVDLAKKYGMRYVHLPHGYDGVPNDRIFELAKAVRELPGPIYIHCHHGKHRSPAAAASACIAAGLMNNQQGLTVLEAAGTGKNYLGLFQSVREAKPIDAEKLANTKVEYPEVSKIPPLADAMIAIEHTHDHLKLVAENAWKPTEKHRDIDPPHEALMLHEHFTELLRTPEAQKKSADFRQFLAQGEAEAKALDELLHKPTAKPAEIDAAFARVTASCTTCHTKIRDIPLQQKAAKK